MSRYNPIVTGIVIIVIGVIFLAFPGLTGSMFSVFIGAGFLVSAVSALISWWNLRKVMPSGGVLIFGIVDFILGAICLLHPLATAISLGWIVAICIIAAGVGRIITSISTPFITGINMVLCILSGLCSILFGGLALVFPEMIMYFLGAGLLITGITTLILGIKAKPIDVDPE